MEFKLELPHFEDTLTCGDPTSPVAICCLWLKQDNLRKALPPGGYAVLGNLYSAAGLMYLLRTLLWNPQLRTLVLCGPDLSGTGRQIRRVFERGLAGDDGPSCDGASVDLGIEPALLDRLRRAVQLVDRVGTVRPVEITDAVAGLGEGQREPWNDRRLHVPLPDPPAVTAFPHEPAVAVVRGGTLEQTWVQLLRAVLLFGPAGDTDYGVQQKELIDLVGVVGADAPVEPTRLEWAPQVDAGAIAAYVPQVLTARPVPGVAYTYGTRLLGQDGQVDQIKALSEELRRSKVSRRALACTWRPEQDAGADRPPCLVTVQARLDSQDRLSLTAYFRSHDVYGAWLPNAFALRRLQNEVAQALPFDAGLGELVLISHSAHIYASDWGPARAVVDAHIDAAVPPPRLARDPRGAFHIRIQDGQILVAHYTPQGALLQQFSGKTGASLFARLEPFIGQVSHALYLGGELQKAELALALGLDYRQDRRLRLG